MMNIFMAIVYALASFGWAWWGFKMANITWTTEPIGSIMIVLAFAYFAGSAFIDMLEELGK